MANKINRIPCSFCNAPDFDVNVKALRFDDVKGRHYLEEKPACLPCAKAMAMPTSQGVVDLLVAVRAAARRLGL